MQREMKKRKNKSVCKKYERSVNKMNLEKKRYAEERRKKRNGK